MKLKYILILAAALVTGGVTRAETLQFVNLTTNAYLVDVGGSLQSYQPGVTTVDLSIAGQSFCDSLNASMQDDGNFTLLLSPSHSATILVDYNGVESFVIQGYSNEARFMQGFAFIFSMGLLGTGARWVKKLMVGGHEESE